MKRLLVLSCFVALACGDDDRTFPDGGPTRDVGGSDAGPGFDVPAVSDAGPPVDSGPGSVDSGPGPVDSGPGLDAGPPPVDAPPPFDGGRFDAGFDAGPINPDAGPPVDAGSDAGPPPDAGTACSIGRAGYGPCTPDRGCLVPAGQFCEGERAFAIGGGADPIMSAPPGVDPVPQIIFNDGICTPSPVQNIGSAGACDPDDADETACGPCGRCIEITTGGSMCLSNCEPNVTDNDTCRDGYTCSLTDAVCLPLGCASDDECRVSRQDNNGVPGIQTPTLCTAFPAECAGGVNNFDRLVYDLSSAAVCNSDTWECEGAPSNAAAAGGDMCAVDADCEAGGRCIQEGGSCSTDSDVDCVVDSQCTSAITGAATNGVCNTSWSGGACIKLGCDIAGNGCANGGICQERGLGVPACLDGCSVGAGANPANPATWITPATGAGGCRSGYNCFWNGVGGNGAANNGVCIPGEFSAIAADNVGAQCDTASDCWGPFGQQRCLRFFAGDATGICTVNDCTAPFFSDPSVNVCGMGNSCVDFGDPGDPFGLCMQGCASPSDCAAPDHGCVEIAAGSGDVCFPGCADSTDCQAGRTCVGAGADLGECL